ncbi:hypothetical protein L596_024818 [Steinernema carpocapsae]|uniref:F-box domain-containing protein n=1 Tax=Steinernema carpocapsae TaxID=34508 RepID=A0A4U5M5W7_STECR|nr:hypothetical protein L596_024818 [Steinernema carpocapsae]
MDSVPLTFIEDVVSRLDSSDSDCFDRQGIYHQVAEAYRAKATRLSIYIYMFEDGSKFGFKASGVSGHDSLRKMLTFEEVLEQPKKFHSCVRIGIYRESNVNREQPPWLSWDGVFLQKLISHLRQYSRVQCRHPLITNSYALSVPGQFNEELKEFLRFQFKNGRFETLFFNSISFEDEEWVKEVLRMFFASPFCHKLSLTILDVYRIKMLLFAETWANFEGSATTNLKKLFIAGRYHWDLSELELFDRQRENKKYNVSGTEEYITHQKVAFLPTNPRRRMAWRVDVRGRIFFESDL